MRRLFSCFFEKKGSCDVVPTGRFRPVSVDEKEYLHQPSRRSSSDTLHDQTHAASFNTEAALLHSEKEEINLAEHSKTKRITARLFRRSVIWRNPLKSSKKATKSRNDRA